MSRRFLPSALARAATVAALLLALILLPRIARAQAITPAADDPLLLANSSDDNAHSPTGPDINPLEILARAGDSLPSSGKPAGGISTALNIVVLLTVISLAPSIMLMTTCFVRIIVVLSLLRQALGTQQLPPPQVIMGLSLCMTLLVMAPTLDRIHKEAILPYNSGQVRGYEDLWNRARQPMKDFMLDQVEATGNYSSLYMVLNYRGIDTSHPERITRADIDMVSLVPAYMLSELKVAFLMGFRVYLPFLVIDMVIASLLISMSMMMLPPVLISLPFKLLLFVLVDGWQLVAGSLMSSFVMPNSAASAAMTSAGLPGP